jgi:endonuclease/exonuclease/phosphatase family metal-dependent hydrolase
MPKNKSLVFFAFLVCFCGGFFALLYTNRNYHRPIPPGAVWSPPEKAIRIVCCNVRRNQATIDKVFDEIRKLEPDIVLLQEVEKTQLSQMTEALQTLPAIYHASENIAGQGTGWGNAICSRYPLYEGSSVPQTAGGSFGVWATAVVGNAKFKVASIYLAPAGHDLRQLVQGWQGIGAPPIVLGGIVNQQPTTHPWADALPVKHVRDTTILTSKEWKLIESGGSDDQPVWILAGK